MQRAIVSCVGAFLWLASGAAAQGFVEGLEAAEKEMDAGRLRETLEILLSLQERVELDEDRDVLAARLCGVGDALQAVASLDLALRAHGAALGLRQNRYGAADHPDVATSRSEVAGCLQGLGRAEEALVEVDLALAMRRRLYGDREHPDVATSLHHAGVCLVSLGRSSEALSRFESALAMHRRLHADRDHPDVATSFAGVAGCLMSLGRADEALPRFESALAMWLRLHPEADHPAVVMGLNDVAGCLMSLGRADEALPKFESGLAMSKRVYGGRDHPVVAESLDKLAECLESLGRGGDALTHFEAALAMRKRLYAGQDHPLLAESLNNLAGNLFWLGRVDEALRLHEAALAMRSRLFRDRDHPAVAAGFNNVGACLRSLGRPDEALPHYEMALAIWQRLHRDRDHPMVETGLTNVAYCLQSLGRLQEALPRLEHSLAMCRRIHGERDHAHVVASLNNVANCLGSLGRATEALPLLEAALAMCNRLHGDRDHPDMASTLNNFAACLESSGRVAEALSQHEASLSMWRRLHGNRAHPRVAASLHNTGSCLEALGRSGEALSRLEAALEMRRDLYGDRDHPDAASSMAGVARCLEALGRLDESLPLTSRAVAMIERLRDDTQTSSDLRQSLFEDMKRGGVFERLQRLASRLGRTSEALEAAERSRGRGLLDRLAQVGDLDAEAVRRARLRGDELAASRLGELHAAIGLARTESDRKLHELTRLDDLPDAMARAARRAELRAGSEEANTKLRQLLDERARLIGDVLPVGRVRGVAEIQAALRDGEVLLEFTVTASVALLYVVARDGVRAIELPEAFPTMRRVLPRMLQASSRPLLRGRDPADAESPADPDVASRELFTSLIPASTWEHVRQAKRVFVAAHRELHRVPFELLVVDRRDGKPLDWLDAGPPISYVPSGTMLHWLRRRSKDVSDDPTSLDLLVVGDPSRLDAEPEPPELGAFVVAVNEGGEGARVGLQPGDVLVAYDGTSISDDKALRDARMATERAIEDGQREKKPVPLAVWRRGTLLSIEARAGLLGIQVGSGRARSAYEATLVGGARLQHVRRSGDLERIGKLPPLRGARAETEAIEKVFADRKTKRLLGADATEPAVFDLAPKAKYLHFACHGIAEEYAGQSLSMLVLSLPQHVLPADDGLLKVSELLETWRGRISSCRLVVLSACRTNVGPTLRDESPQALPIGFLFAGAPAVISSLWAVDDASTKELMIDFYSRLLAGETDQLAAFTAAKKALRAKYPDPFHWAPFLYLGAPE